MNYCEECRIVPYPCVYCGLERCYCIGLDTNTYLHWRDGAPILERRPKRIREPYLPGLWDYFEKLERRTA